MNRANIDGRLGRDPEIRSMTSGGQVMSLSVGTTERWVDSAGEKRERTEWHRVVIFSEWAIKRYGALLRKGDRVSIEGQIQTRKWQKDGRDVYTTEIVVQKFGGSVMAEVAVARREADAGRAAETTGTASSADLDDHVPF